MLSPATRSSASQATPWLRRRSHSQTRYVGIDIGIDYVNVATFGLPGDRIKRSAAPPSLQWLTQSGFRLPVDPQAPPPPDWVDVVVESLHDRLPRCVDGDQNTAVIALPIPWIHYQTTEGADTEAIQKQCDSMFAASIFDSRAHLSKWPVAVGRDQLMIAATAESAACRVAESIAEVGYQVQSILPQGVALFEAAPALTSIKPSAILLLELSGGMIALPNGSGCGLCRNLPPCAIPTGARPYLEELQSWLLNIASEVNATSRYVSRLSGDDDTQSPLLVCGGAAQISGIDAALATLLGRPVALWQYAGRSRPRRQDRSSSHSPMAVSLSLAHCGTRRSSETEKPCSLRESSEDRRP